jgi:serine/threonine protein kinase
MTPERYEQIIELCQTIWDLAPENRTEFLTRAVKGDDALRREAEAMLTADAQSSTFLLETPDDLAASAFSSRQPQLPIGECLGDYKILACLGVGGMGQVFVAQDLRLRRKAVVKLLPQEFNSEPSWLRRFEEEACAVSGLNHPNILTVYGFGRVGSINFLATEYVDGRTLREVMAEGPLSLSRAIDITIQIAFALAAAHSSGIVHRDIKPENIIVRHDGLVKILDFGIAKRSGPWNGQPDDRFSFEPMPGVLVGTPRYMSPEQACGLPFDSRTDLFSLGSVIYEMLAGSFAFGGETPSDVLAAVLTHEPASLATLSPPCPADVASVVNRALCRKTSTTGINRRLKCFPTLRPSGRT